MNGQLKYNPEILPFFKNILWKSINQQTKNDYDKSMEIIYSDFLSKKFPLDKIKTELNRIYTEVVALRVEALGPKQTPPEVK